MEELKSTKVDWKKITVVGALVLLTALTVGSGVWYAMDASKQAELDVKDDEIATLQTRVTENETTNGPKPVAVDIADWKTYTNKFQKFSLKYPSDWALTETAGGATLKKGNEGFGITGFENPNKLNNEEWLAEEIENGNIGEDIQNKSTKTIGNYQVLTLQDNGIIIRYVYIFGENSKILEVANYTTGISDSTKSVIEAVIKTIVFN